jgi:hypothetical protein
MENETNIRTAAGEDKDINAAIGAIESEGEGYYAEDQDYRWKVDYLNAVCYAFSTVSEIDAAVKGRRFEERKRSIESKCFDMIEWLIDDMHSEFEE